MININFFKIKKNHNKYLIDFLKMVPSSMQNNIMRYYSIDDQMKCIVGKLIIRKMMIKQGYSDNILSDYKLDEFNRPYLNYNIDFNISHSGNYVVCAISDNTNVGIDIEKITKINFDDFDFLLNDTERSKFKDKWNNKLFYSYWTKKEAVSKAEGKGLGIPFSEILIKNDKARYKNKSWNIKEIKINDDYCSYLAYLGEVKIEKTELFLSDLV